MHEKEKHELFEKFSNLILKSKMLMKINSFGLRTLPKVSSDNLTMPPAVICTGRCALRIIVKRSLLIRQLTVEEEAKYAAVDTASL